MSDWHTFEIGFRVGDVEVRLFAGDETAEGLEAKRGQVELMAKFLQGAASKEEAAQARAIVLKSKTPVPCGCGGETDAGVS